MSSQKHSTRRGTTRSQVSIWTDGQQNPMKVDLSTMSFTKHSRPDKGINSAESRLIGNTIAVKKKGCGHTSMTRQEFNAMLQDLSQDPANADLFAGITLQSSVARS